jgi:hypothetical protein
MFESRIDTCLYKVTLAVLIDNIYQIGTDVTGGFESQANFVKNTMISWLSRISWY